MDSSTNTRDSQSENTINSVNSQQTISTNTHANESSSGSINELIANSQNELKLKQQQIQNVQQTKSTDFKEKVLEDSNQSNVQDTRITSYKQTSQNSRVKTQLSQNKEDSIKKQQPQNPVAQQSHQTVQNYKLQQQEKILLEKARQLELMQKQVVQELANLQKRQQNLSQTQEEDFQQKQNLLPSQDIQIEKQMNDQLCNQINQMNNQVLLQQLPLKKSASYQNIYKQDQVSQCSSPYAQQVQQMQVAQSLQQIQTQQQAKQMVNSQTNTTLTLINNEEKNGECPSVIQKKEKQTVSVSTSTNTSFISPELNKLRAVTPQPEVSDYNRQAEDKSSSNNSSKQYNPLRYSKESSKSRQRSTSKLNRKGKYQNAEIPIPKQRKICEKSPVIPTRKNSKSFKQNQNQDQQDKFQLSQSQCSQISQQSAPILQHISNQQKHKKVKKNLEEKQKQADKNHEEGVLALNTNQLQRLKIQHNNQNFQQSNNLDISELAYPQPQQKVLPKVNIKIASVSQNNKDSSQRQKIIKPIKKQSTQKPHIKLQENSQIPSNNDFEQEEIPTEIPVKQITDLSIPRIHFEPNVESDDSFEHQQEQHIKQLQIKYMKSLKNKQSMQT